MLKMKCEPWHTCKVVASAGGLTIGYVDDRPCIWDGNMHTLQPGNEYREPLPEFTDYKIVNDKWVRVEKQNTRKEKRRGHNEGSIFQRWTARVSVREVDTDKAKKITVCGKSQEELKEKLLKLPGISDINKIPISQSWVAQATIGRTPEGKLKRITFYGDTRKEVSEKMAAALHDVKQGTFTEPSKLTFGEWNLTWLNEYAKPQVRPTTFDSYEYLIRVHINPSLGGYYLKDLQQQPQIIQRFYNQKLTEPKQDRRSEKAKKKDPDRKMPNLSPRLVRYMHIVIHESLEQALKENLIARNPAKATRPPKVEKKEARFLTDEQASKFLSEISTDPWYIPFLITIGSGMRLGEVAALKWRNIDLQKRIIQVKEAVSYIRNRSRDGEPDTPKTQAIFQNPKSQSSIRSIPLPNHVVNALYELKKRQLKNMGKLTKSYKINGINEIGDNYSANLRPVFVFTWPDGRRVSPLYLSKHFLKLARKNNLEGIHFHSLRHSYASMLLQAGEHPKVVQELLGHATVTMTLDIYSHVAPGLKEAAAGRLEGLLNIERSSAVGED
jgi:integrase